jgi:exopolysaccharide production protein ExoQ
MASVVTSYRIRDDASGGSATAACVTEQSAPLERIPLLPALYLAVCFFLAIHDFQASTWDINRPADFFAATSGSGSVQTKLAFLMLGFYGAVGFLRQRTPKLSGDGLAALFALMLFLWTVLSFIWADNHTEPLGRIAGIVGLFLTALHMRRTYTARAKVLWITLCTFGYVVLGLATEVALGTLKPWQFDYRFSGTLHPNAQGINCSIALLGAGCMLFMGRRHRLLWTAVAVVALICDLLTRSRTALFSLFLAVVAGALATQRRRGKRWILFSGTALLTVALSWVSSTGVLALNSVAQLGRDQNTSDNGSLTGRVPLWAELMETIQRRPWIGQGYGEFWTVKNIDKISADQGWGISAAHSTYVDVLLALGVIGLALYLLTLGISIMKARSRYLQAPDPQKAYFGIMLIFMLIDGVTDSEPVIVSAFLCFCLMLTIMEVLTHPRQESVQSIATEA